MASAAAAVSTLDDGTLRGNWFTTPVGITTDKNNLYVTDSACNDITTMSPASGVKLSDMTSSTKAVNIERAGNCGVAAGAFDGLATNATFDKPYGIAIDNTYLYLYVADINNNKIRRIEIATGNTISLTGTHIANAAANIGYADGLAANASFSGPAGIATDGKSLFVMDTANNTIRKIAPTTNSGATLGTMTDSTATVSTLAGVATLNNPADGTGMAARLGKTQYSTSDGTNLYVTDCGTNAEIRKVVIATGVATTLAGSSVKSSVDNTGTAATFTCPKGITTDGTNLYVVDGTTVRKIAPATGTLDAMSSANAVVTTMVPSGSGVPFTTPVGITTDGSSLYVADGSKVVRIAAPSGAMLSSMNAASGVASSIAASVVAATGITTDGKNLFVSDNSSVVKIAPPSGVSLSGMLAASAVASNLSISANGFSTPSDITSDGVNLYVVDKGNNKIRMIAPAGGATLANISAASSVVSSITGGSGVPATGYLDSTGALSTFNAPTGITTDGVSLYVTDSTNGTIRKIK